MATYRMRRSPGLAAAILAMTLALFGAAPGALATDYSWEGDDAVSPTDWTLPENWATHIVPTAGDGAVFDPGLATGFVVDVAGIYTAVAKIDFNNISEAVGSQFELAPRGYLLLGDGATAAEIEHDSAAATPQDGASLISADVSAVLLGATRDLVFDINSGTLTLSGRLGTAAQAVNLVAPGDGGSNVEAGGVLVLANADPAAPNNVTGALTVAGELRVFPYGLASTSTPPAVVLTGAAAVLDLRAATIGSAVTLGGGTVQAAGACAISGAVTDAADMTFAADDTLTFSHGLGIALTGNRTWTVAEGTVVVSGDVTDDGGGPYDLTVLGPGTLRLDSGAMGVDMLTCGSHHGYGDAGLDGLTVIGDPTRRPAYVLIHNKAAYSVAADHAYDEVDFSASDGCIAIGADTTSPIAMFGPAIRLGAAQVGDGNHTFSGTLTPYDDTYYLGGGRGTLTVAPDVLVDTDYDGTPGADPTHVQIGVAFGGGGPDDITAAGMVVLQGDDRFAGVTGTIYLDGFAAIARGPDAVHGDVLSAIDDAAAVVLYPTGGLDLGDADITGLGPAAFGGSGLFDMQGGGISRNGGTVTEADVEELWGPQEPYGGLNGPVFEVTLGGGIVPGGLDTTLVDYGAVAADIFRKTGPNTVVMNGKPGDWGAGDPGETGDETYMLDVYVEDGRLVFEDDSAVGEKANLPDPIYDGTVLVTVSGGAVAEIQASDNTPDEAVADFTLLDGATLVLPAAGQTYYAAGLEIGDTIAPTSPAGATLGGGGTLNLEHVEYPDGTTPTTVIGAVTAVPGSTLTILPGAGLSAARLIDLAQVNLGGTLTLVEGATTLSAVRDSAGGGGGGAYGTLVVGPNATASIAGSADVGGAVVNGAVAVERDGTLAVHGAFTGAATTTVAGALVLDAGGPTTYDGPIDLANDGVLEVASGAVTVMQDITAVVGQPVQPHLNWEASQDPAGDDLFESYWAGAPLNVTASRTWTFSNGVQTPSAVADPVLANVTHAYDFSAAKATALSFDEMDEFGNGDLSAHDFSLEIVFRPADLVGDDILMETGGKTDGTQVYLSGNTLNFHVRDGGDSGAVVTVSYTLPPDTADAMHQVVATYDKNESGGTTDRVTLYFDGVWVGDATHTDLNDWSGTDDAGLGRVNGAAPNTVGDDFTGQIALMRYYDATVLTPVQVLENYTALGAESHAAVSVAEGASLTADRVVDVPLVNLGGTLALADGASTIGRIAGTSPTCALDLAAGVTLNTGAMDDICDITLAAGAMLNVGANSTGIGMVEGASGTLNVAAGVVFQHTADGGFHGLDAVNLGDGAQLTTGETNNRTKVLALGTDAVLDLTSGNLIVDYDTPPAGDYSPEFLAIEALVRSGFQDGPAHYWDGPGINSSAAAASGDHSTALAVFDNAGPGGGKTTLEGEPVDATSVLVKYAWYGDINLDGVVDFNDYNIIDNTFLSGNTTDQHWQRGDLNFDGVVDFNDYNLIDNTFLAHAGETLGGGGPVGVGGTAAPTPEPATLALLGLGAAAMFMRRRSR